MFTWLKTLLGSKPRSAPTSSTTSPAREDDAAGMCLDDASYSANADILDGMRFSATLQVRTPLSILEHHGEIFRGPPSKAPTYGTGADGIWTFNVAGDLGALLAEGATHASDVGSVEPQRYLPFLKAFRTIVESDASHAVQLDRLAELPSKSVDFRSYWKQLGVNYRDFPRSFFYMQLTQLPGVGRVTAQRLYEAGFLSPQAVLRATDTELAAIPKIAPGVIQKIRGG